MILDKNTKSNVIQNTTLEGTSFAQRGGDSNKQIPIYDKKIGNICNI